MKKALLISVVNYIDTEIDSEMWHSVEEENIRVWLHEREFNDDDIDKLLGGQQVHTMDDEYPVAYRLIEV